MWLPAATPAPVMDAHSRARAAVAQGDALCRQGRFHEALTPYREAVALHGDQADYHFRLGVAAWQSGMLNLAEHHLKEAVHRNPNDARAHEAICQYYREAGDLDRAVVHSVRAIELEPNDAEIAITRASTLEASGQAEAAWKLLEPLVKVGMRSGRLGIVFGRLAPKLKREKEALELIQRLLESPGLLPQHKTTLHFTAANLLDRLGEWDAAFKEARLAHQEANPEPYNPAQHTDWIRRQIEYFTPWKLHDLPRASHKNRRPVFIIGMMRSGTSLVEQILASHPQVHGAGELNTLRHIALSAEQSPWAEGTPYPEYLDTLSVRNANELAQTYLSAIAALNDKATYVTDKMPHNFLYLGLIVTLFPDCHIIHCTRDPLDTCLSCYMTQFVAHRHEFTHNLSHLGAFYRDYDRLVRHWKQRLNYPMLDVHYEDLVNDLPGQTRQMLEFLDLPWDDRCLQFHQNKRHVMTASYDQVRRPIYTSSLGRWKHYEKHLSQLVTSLGPCGTIKASA
ncbi:MAG: tetratricopeptide repeat-containing sulfotransferase family protein [Bacillota bacterium]